MCHIEVNTSNDLGFLDIQYLPASHWAGSKHYGSSGILQKLAWLVVKPWRRETTQVLLKFLQCKNYIILNTIVWRMGWVRTWKRGAMRTHEVDSTTRRSWLGICLILQKLTCFWKLNILWTASWVWWSVRRNGRKRFSWPSQSSGGPVWSSGVFGLIEFLFLSYNFSSKNPGFLGNALFAFRQALSGLQPKQTSHLI